MPTPENSNRSYKDQITSIVNSTQPPRVAKTCVLGCSPPFDKSVQDAVAGLHGFVAGTMNRVFFYPMRFTQSGNLDIINVGLGLNGAGTADTLRVGFYDQDLVFIGEAEVSFTAGTADTWVSSGHSGGTLPLPPNFMVGILPELSTDKTAQATVEYAYSETGAQVNGFDMQFVATGNPNTAVMMPFGYTTGIITRPAGGFVWPASFNVANLSNGSTTFGAYRAPALRIGVVTLP